MSVAEIHPVFVLHGNDAFLLDAARQEIIDRVLNGADPQLSLSSLDGDTSLAEVLDELRTAPFLAPRRLVIVRQADHFVTQHRQALETYLEAPCPTSSLVLIVASWNRNTRLAKLVNRIGQTVSCELDEKSNLAGRLREMAGKRGKKLTSDAADLLEQWVGRDLALLEGHIEKLSLYVAERPEITAEDVARMVTATAGPNPFDLPNAVAAGDIPTAMRLLRGLIAVKGEEYRVLGLIAWYFRVAAKARRQLDAGARVDVAMRYDSRQHLLNMVRRRPVGVLREDFRRLLRADLALKTGQDAALVLEQLVADLCTPAQGERQAAR